MNLKCWFAVLSEEAGSIHSPLIPSPWARLMPGTPPPPPTALLSAGVSHLAGALWTLEPNGREQSPGGDLAQRKVVFAANKELTGNGF